MRLSSAHPPELFESGRVVKWHYQRVDCLRGRHMDSKQSCTCTSVSRSLYDSAECFPRCGGPEALSVSFHELSARPTSQWSLLAVWQSPRSSRSHEFPATRSCAGAFWDARMGIRADRKVFSTARSTNEFQDTYHSYASQAACAHQGALGGQEPASAGKVGNKMSTCEAQLSV